MLIKCPECKNMISSTALACPHCGYNMKEDKNPTHHHSKSRIDELKDNFLKKYPNLKCRVECKSKLVDWENVYYTELTIDFDEIFNTNTYWELAIICLEEHFLDAYVFVKQTFFSEVRQKECFGQVLLTKSLIKFDMRSIWTEIFRYDKIGYVKEYYSRVNINEIINDIKLAIGS